MGLFLRVDDVYVGSLLELLNVRFCRYPSAVARAGIDEMQDLQREFVIFKQSRALKESLRALNVGGTWNPVLKEKWFSYLSSLDKADSDRPGVKGGPSIVGALVENLAAKKPLPVHFRSHDLNDAAFGNKVIITVGRPVFYMVEDHLTISLPMARPDAARKVPAKRKRTRNS